MSLQDLAVNREQEAASSKESADILLKVLNQLHEESKQKRLTIEDLQLTHTERITLKACDTQLRNALWKSMEHFCLTAIPECCRQTAVRMREYQRTLTLSDKNKIKGIDDDTITMANERSKQYFRK